MSDDRAHGTVTSHPADEGSRSGGEDYVSVGVPIGGLTARVRELTRLGVRLQHVSSRRTGMSPADLSAMGILMREVVGPADLARQLDVSTAAATGIVDRLVARGAVERQPIPGDRRRTALHVTELGRSEYTRQLRVMVEGLEAIEQDFTPADRAVVERYLTRAAEVITRAVEAAPED